MSLPIDPKAQPRSPTDEWFREMAERLEWYFIKHTRHPEEAPDLAQDVLVSTLDSTTDIESLDNPGAYLMTTARNLAGSRRVKDQWETQNLESLSDDSPIAPTHQPQSPEPHFLGPALDSALRKLDSVDQDVLWYWLIGCSYKEISALTSVPVHQVHRKRCGAIELLRSLLKVAPAKGK